jgi:hypothetical protein
MDNLERNKGVQLEAELRSRGCHRAYNRCRGSGSCGVYHVVAQDIHFPKFSVIAGNSGVGAGSEVAEFERAGAIGTDGGFDECKWPAEPNAERARPDSAGSEHAGPICWNAGFARADYNCAYPAYDYAGSAARQFGPGFFAGFLEHRKRFRQYTAPSGDTGG